MIEAEPTLFDHRLRLARFFDAQGAHEKAEAVLREAIALDPNSEERRLLLADFLSTRKDHPAAEQALLEAATQLPHSTKIQFGLAALYLKSGQDAKAREQYAALVKDYKEKPAGLEAKVKLAEMDLIAGKQAEAERQVQEVLKENPRSSDGLILSGRMALARRNGKDAVQAFRTVLHDQPELATVHFLLGQAYLLTGENNLAKESFEHAVALYPGQVDARRSLAALESQSGRHQQARARLDDLLKQRPDDLAALDMLMMVDLVTKNWVEAEHTLERLRAASKDSAVAIMAEGRLRQAQGQFDKASAAYERATALAPNDPEPLLSLVKLDVAQGHADRATDSPRYVARRTARSSVWPWATGRGAGPQRPSPGSRRPISRGFPREPQMDHAVARLGRVVAGAETAGPGGSGDSSRSKGQPGQRGVAHASGIGLFHSRPDR